MLFLLHVLFVVAMYIQILKKITIPLFCYGFALTENDRKVKWPRLQNPPFCYDALHTPGKQWCKAAQGDRGSNPVLCKIKSALEGEISWLGGKTVM